MNKVVVVSKWTTGDPRLQRVSPVNNKKEIASLGYPLYKVLLKEHYVEEEDKSNSTTFYRMWSIR